jgi:hypothetical protein
MATEATAPQRPHVPSNKLIPLDNVRVRLAIVWLTGGCLVLVTLAIQSLLHAYGTLTQEAWGWFLPTLTPTLGMIITVLGYTALDPLASGSVVRRAFFLIAFSLSVFYLALVSLTVFIQPFASSTPEERISLMRTSNLWLGPVQGAVASALGVLFVSKQKKDG